MFDSAEKFRKFVEGLILDQESISILIGLPLQYDSMIEDAVMLASIDRTDSDGHYEQGNLQVVGHFINRWKSSDKDANFFEAAECSTWNRNHINRLPPRT